MKRNSKNYITSLLTLVSVLLIAVACEREEIPIETTDDILMGEYIKENSNFTQFQRLAELTGFTGFINAYGSYTFFIPTDSAFQAYFDGNDSVKSLDDLTPAEQVELFQYHIVNDTISSVYFTDGKLQTASMNGKYLITGVTLTDEGKAKYIVNKKAVIENLDVEVGNGVIHEIDQVLTPPSLSVAEMIEANDDYSIFTEALQKTGVYDIINDKDSWYTVLVQSNEVYNEIGITSYDELAAKYSHLGDPTNPEDSLYLYMLYHCLPGAEYIADLVQVTSHLTVVPQEVITIKVDGDVVLINDQTIAGTYYPGAEIIRDNSDNSAFNGVIHELDANIYIKVLLPVAVYWDPTEQPEMKKLTGIYKTAGFSTVYFGQGELSEMDWGGTNSSVGYWAEGYAMNSDVLDIYLRTSVIPWAELKTPLIIKGTYKVWMCYRANPYGNLIQITFDDQELSELLQIGNYGQRPSAISEADYEAIGYKWYLEDSNNNRVAARLVGTIEVESTGEHTLRFDAINNNRGHLWLDMVQFIPADEDQIWPKFDYDGNFVYEPEDTATVDSTVTTTFKYYK